MGLSIAALLVAAAAGITVPPTAVPRNGVYWLAYELQIEARVDACSTPLELQILDADSGEELAVLPVDRSALSKTRLYVDLDVPEPPRRLQHRLGCAGGEGPAIREQVADVAVGEPDALKVLSPPVQGGPWIAVYDPELPRGHRRYVYTEAGEERIPGRYAIDWIAAKADGKVHSGDGRTLEQWHGYGAAVLAVDNAVVVAVRNDAPEHAPSTPFSDGPGTGNLVVLGLDDGTYAFYEHLRPDSIRVRVGDQVTRGQAIAELGNTGHSMTPHLHFHLADGPGPLGAEGVPYLLEDASRLGCYPSIEAALAGNAWGECPKQESARRSWFPLPNQVLQFPK